MADMMYEQWQRITGRSPRPAGSREETRVKEFITAAVQREGFEPDIHAFSYQPWHLHSFSGLFQLTPERKELEACPAVGSTGVEYIEGTIQRIGFTNVWDMYKWPRYAVMDQHHKAAAYITARPDGGALSQTLLESWDFPHLIIGSSIWERWETYLTQGREITVSFSLEAGALEETQGENISVQIPGKDKTRSILIGAHYDSMYNTWGAYDNASGTAVLLELLRRLRTIPPAINVELVFFTAEELLLAGSRAFAASRKKELLTGFEGMLNIDGIGRGNTLEHWSTSRMNQKLSFASDKLKELFPASSVLIPPPPGSDHDPFVKEEAAMLTINDQDIIHTFKDKPDIQMYENMKNTADYLQYIVENYPESKGEDKG
ncbi:M28 family metallopeptidase [Salibacterium sp. K-3]